MRFFSSNLAGITWRLRKSNQLENKRNEMRKNNNKKHTTTFLRDDNDDDRLIRCKILLQKNNNNNIYIYTLIKTSSSRLLGSGILILLNTRCYSPKTGSVIAALPQSTTEGSIVQVRVGGGVGRRDSREEKKPGTICFGHVVANRR